jgi:Ca-activated chloride channel family protein
MGRTVRVWTRRAVAVLLAGSVAGLTMTSAQEVFRASTDMVFLSVTATRGNTAVTGLEETSFAVFEDGRRQDIEVFSRDPQPIALSLLIDASTSMENRMSLAADAAVGFVRRMRPSDLAQVMTFNAQTDIRQPFTDNQQLLEQAIRSARASGSTGLYTALYIAFSELDRIGRQQRGEMRRQAIVLLSDGEDTTSVLGYDEVMERARRSDVIVFAVALREPASSATQGMRQHDFALRSLAQATGGRVFTVDTAAQLPQVYNQIADELATQYTIGYTSRNTNRDGRWRQITVQVDAPGVVARTRAGYFGPSRAR